MAKTEKMRRIELERGKSMESIISEAADRGWTWEMLAEDLGVARLTLRDWTKKRLGGRAQTRRVIHFCSEEQAP